MMTLAPKFSKNGKKRCMTDLDPETWSDVTKIRGDEDRSESQMIAILVKEAITARKIPRRPSMGHE